MTADLRDVVAVLLAPFDQQQALNKVSLHRLVQLNTQQGIGGLYAGGSTGEAFVQSPSECKQIPEIVAEEARGKVELIAHVGCVNTAESQQLTVSAKHYSFDAISVVMPPYYPLNFKEYYDRYQVVIDSVDGPPMVMYNILALSGVKLTPDQINTLVTLPGVGILKQASGDLCQMKQVHRKHPDLVLYNGYNEIFVSGLLAGVDGGTGSTHNIMDQRYQGIAKAPEEDDIQTVQKLQTKCSKVIDLLTKTGVFRGLKAVLHYMDVASMSLCRELFGPVDEKYLPGLKMLAQQLMQERGRVASPRSPLPDEGE